MPSTVMTESAMFIMQLGKSQAMTGEEGAMVSALGSFAANGAFI